MAKNLFHTLNCVFERLGLTKKFSKDSCREKIQFFFLSRGSPLEIFKGGVNHLKDSFKMKLSKVNYYKSILYIYFFISH